MNAWFALAFCQHGCECVSTLRGQLVVMTVLFVRRCIWKATEAFTGCCQPLAICELYMQCT
jgi:hypothetical protein